MIENRKDLTHEEVEKGMDFNKILKNSNAIKKGRLKLTIMVSSIISITVTGIIVFFNTHSSKNVTPNHPETTPINIQQPQALATETYSLFIGNKVAKGELACTVEEIRKIKSIDLKSTSNQPTFKLISFTFTTLTKNGISQINVTGNLFNAEIIELLKTVKAGQTLYLENIIVQDQNASQTNLEPITVSIK